MTETDLTPAPSRRHASGRSRAGRVGRGVLVALAAVSIVAHSGLIATAGWAAAHPRAVGDALTVWQYEPTPAISGYATRAAMSERGRFLFYASAPQVVAGAAFDDVCSRDEPDIGVLGCYTLADGRIYLFDITNVDLASFEVVVAAHEMLHAAWDRLSPEEQDALVGPLEEAFASVEPDSELFRRIAAYEQFDLSSRIPELYAIVGTEFSVVSDTLELHYAEYFDDRAVVVSLWQQVETLFSELDAELTRLGTELDRLAAEIDAEQVATEQAAGALREDITAFNERAARPGGYPSRSAFDDDRRSLIERQNSLTAAIDATNAKIAAYNAVRDEFTALNAEAEALNRDLNIDPQPIDSGPSDSGPIDSEPIDSGPADS
jgi:hypothetical protein